MSVYISLGSNIGDRLDHLRNAIGEIVLIPDIELLRTSSVYETEPVGVTNQDWFYNAVIELRTDLDPYDVLEFTQTIERKLKKDIKYRWGPRRIDIDLLDYDGMIIQSERLILPHPRMNLRKFVLVPLSEVAPCFVHPILSTTVWTMRTNCPESSVIKIKENV